MPIPPQLITQICRRSSRPVSGGVRALCEEILARYGTSAAAVLYYGSCFRRGDDREGIVDLYVLVDSYREAYRKHVPSVLNRLLPPNVFYLEVPFEKSVVRAKYAVLSLADLERRTSRASFHSYFWARFAQPAGLAYARSDQVAGRVHRALVQAVMTFLVRVLPEVASPFTTRDLWRKGLLLSYRAELRTEAPDDVVRLFDADAQYYETLTRAAMSAVPFDVESVARGDTAVYQVSIPDRVRCSSRMGWAVRCLQGKALSILRLLKGLFTFEGGLDYILWKIERHSGVSVTVEPRLRRRPVLGVCVLFWRLYRRGGFR